MHSAPLLLACNSANCIFFHLLGPSQHQLVTYLDFFTFLGSQLSVCGIFYRNISELNLPYSSMLKSTLKNNNFNLFYPSTMFSVTNSQVGQCLHNHQFWLLPRGIYDQGSIITMITPAAVKFMLLFSGKSIMSILQKQSNL